MESAMEDNVLNKIINWAKGETDIRIIILEGSRASNSEIDELSDYDLNLFVVNPDSYTSDNSWLKNFDDILVYQKEKFLYKNLEIPTRLVVYKNSPRVDFSFWPIEALYDVIENKMLPESYKNGYRVLLDKDKITDKIIFPDYCGFTITRPTKDQLLKSIYDFWFEAYCIAKYLKRERLWYAKTLENGSIKKLLLQIILWRESYKCNWKNNKIHLDGKNIEDQIDENVKKSFEKCFSKYNIDDTWESLFETINLFKKLSFELAELMNIEYPFESVLEIEKSIRKLNKT
jgi:aminoglycoside 6-adenylyltransferase